MQCHGMNIWKRKRQYFFRRKMWAGLANNDSWCFLFSSMDDLWKRRDYKVSLCIYPNASFIWWIPLPAYSEDSQYREYSDYSGHSTLSADSAESLVRKKWPANGKRPNGKIQIFAKWKNSPPDFWHHPCHTYWRHSKFFCFFRWRRIKRHTGRSKISKMS